MRIEAYRCQGTLVLLLVWASCLYIFKGIMMKIQFDLRGMRETYGVTQEEVAHVTGLTQAMVSRLEREDVARIDLGTLEKLCEAFRVHPGELFEAEYDDGRLAIPRVGMAGVAHTAADAARMFPNPEEKPPLLLRDSIKNTQQILEKAANLPANVRKNLKKMLTHEQQRLDEFQREVKKAKKK